MLSGVRKFLCQSKLKPTVFNINRCFCGKSLSSLRSNLNLYNSILSHLQFTNSPKALGIAGQGQISFGSFCLRRLASMSDSEDKKSGLKERLTPIQYHVTQEKGTERAFTGKYNKCYDTGMYSCVVCDQPLFSSQTKYDSGCGWPAFNDVLDQGKVKLTKDTSHGMVRTEVTCAQCNSHLGHVFGDGPAPSRKRFCINSASLQFHPAQSCQDNPDSP